MLLRSACIVVALAMLAAAAHVTITHSGGYETSYAVLVMAMTAGVGVGALTIGAAHAQRRYFMAFLLVIPLIACEAFGLLNTASRIVAQSEQAQGPARAAADAQARAVERWKEARARLAASERPTIRLTAAIAVQRAAVDAAAADAAKRSCASNCRKIHEKAIAAATVELEAARAEMLQQRTKAIATLETAQAELAAMPRVASGTPLADRLQVPNWILDLLRAGLGSFGANGMAAVLLAFAGHGWRAPTSHVECHDVPHVSKAPRPTLHLVADETEHALKFSGARIRPQPGARTPLVVILAHYERWCIATGTQPLSEVRITEELCQMFKEQGLQGIEIDGEPYLIGIAMRKSTELRKAA